jgi:hypothetical protein
MAVRRQRQYPRPRYLLGDRGGGEVSLALFHAVVDRQGRLQWHDMRGLERFLGGHVGRHFRVSFAEPKRRRSDRQHRFYFGVVVKYIAEFTGMNTDETHDALKYKYLKTEQIGDIWKVRSTTELSTKEFTEYVDSIVADAATGDLLGAPLYIPLPQE